MNKSIIQRINDSHSKTMGYMLWFFGFTGAHRFYFGKKKTGALWFFTGGLFLVGWLIDIFLIPEMDEQASTRYLEGVIEYNICWILLTFLGIFGIHRFYMGKVFTGILYLCTGGVFGLGLIYDLWTLNEQITKVNRSF